MQEGIVSGSFCQRLFHVALIARSRQSPVPSRGRPDSEDLWRQSVDAQEWGTFFRGIHIPKGNKKAWDKKFFKQAAEAATAAARTANAALAAPRTPAAGVERPTGRVPSFSSSLLSSSPQFTLAEREYMATSFETALLPPIMGQSTPGFLRLARHYLEVLLDPSTAEEARALLQLIDIKEKRAASTRVAIPAAAQPLEEDDNADEDLPEILDMIKPSKGRKRSPAPLKDARSAKRARGSTGEPRKPKQQQQERGEQERGSVCSADEEEEEMDRRMLEELRTLAEQGGEAVEVSKEEAWSRMQGQIEEFEAARGPTTPSEMSVEAARVEEAASVEGHGTAQQEEVQQKPGAPEQAPEQQARAPKKSKSAKRPSEPRASTRARTAPKNYYDKSAMKTGKKPSKKTTAPVEQGKKVDFEVSANDVV